MDLNDLLKDQNVLKELIGKKDAEIKAFIKEKGVELSDEQFEKLKDAVAKLAEGKESIEAELKSAAEDLIKGGLKNIFKK